MYERFTNQARQVLQLANEESQRYKHEYVGTEHILLGLIKQGDGVAAIVLNYLGIELKKVRLQVEKVIQSGPDMVTMGKLPWTPRAKKVIEFAIEESRNLKHAHVGTEHLLLGLIREEQGVAAQVLMNQGLKYQNIREMVVNLLVRDPVAPASKEQTLEILRSNKDRYESLHGVKITSAALTAAVELAVDPLPDGAIDLIYQAVALVRLETLPGELGDLDRQIKDLNERKYTAVCETDFELAAHLREQALQLKKKLEKLTEELKKQPDAICGVVDEQMIARVAGKRKTRE